MKTLDLDLLAKLHSPEDNDPEDCLFPNCTDQDIHAIGFSTGFMYFASWHKLSKEKPIIGTLIAIRKNQDNSSVQMYKIFSENSLKNLEEKFPEFSDFRYVDIINEKDDYKLHITMNSKY